LNNISFFSNNKDNAKRKEIVMAKNKTNKYKTGHSANGKYTASSPSQSQTKDSVKSSHAGVPDNSPSRSGPGGE